MKSLAGIHWYRVRELNPSDLLERQAASPEAERGVRYWRPARELNPACRFCRASPSRKELALRIWRPPQESNLDAPVNGRLLFH